MAVGRVEKSLSLGIAGDVGPDEAFLGRSGVAGHSHTDILWPVLDLSGSVLCGLTALVKQNEVTDSRVRISNRAVIVLRGRGKCGNRIEGRQGSHSPSLRARVIDRLDTFFLIVDLTPKVPVGFC